jgi:hypothetical protein
MSLTGKQIAIIATSTALGLVVVLVIGVNVAASFAKRVLPSYAAVSETSQRLTGYGHAVPGGRLHASRMAR